MFGGIDLNFASIGMELNLLRLARYLQGPHNILGGNVTTHKPIDDTMVDDGTACIGQLGVTVSVSLLDNWDAAVSNVSSVFVWVYKTGKCNATNFPLCTKRSTPPLQCAWELSGAACV